MKSKLFRKKLWEGLTVGIASLLVVVTGGYKIADSKSAVINDALKLSTSSINRSDTEYQYFPSSYKDDEYDTLKADYISAAEEIESEGIVMLRNKNGALPLAQGEKVSLMLSGSAKFGYSSTGSSQTDPTGYRTLAEALSGKVVVNSSMLSYYSGVQVCDETEVYDPAWSAMPGDVKSTLDEYGTAIVTIKRISGEGKDLLVSGSTGHDGSYLSLTENELSVLQGLTQLKAQNNKVKKIIVLLNTSSTVQLDFLDGLTTRDGTAYDIDVDACLWVGNVGNGIGGVAKVLTGEVSPSGKLSDTYVKNNLSSPAAATLKLTRRKTFGQVYAYDGDGELGETNAYYGIYNEGIYVGYRYYETRYADYVTGRANVGTYDYASTVAYSFGYGESYADFEYTAFAVTEKADSYDIAVTVKNIGDTTGNTRSGKETVCVYLQKPYTAYDIANGVEKSAVELVGYKKTGVIEPGHSEPVSITVSKEMFKSYDRNRAKTYIVDDGNYYFAVGNGAHDALNNILANQKADSAVSDSVDESKMVGTGNAALAYKVTVGEFDGETYSVSAHYTDKTVRITNRLDFADITKYENGDANFKYLTRSDWEGTFPKKLTTITVNAAMYADLQNNRPIKQNAQATMPVYGANNGKTLAKLRTLPYDDKQWDELLDQMTFEEQSELISSGYFLTVALSSVCKPDTHESDGPTGAVGSKGSLSMPSEGIWASSFNDELVEKVGKMLACDALANGKTGLYANGINIHRMPFGGRTHEYFSEDPYLTGVAAAKEIKGIQGEGVIAHVKHFAFNDQEDHRNGIGIWLNEQEAREIMLLPFEYALAADKGNAHAVMNSFNRAGTKWTGASSELQTDIMRGEWGFDGYAITDMAESNGDFMTHQDGIPNGTDLYLASGSKDALKAFRNNATFCAAMRDASHRILYSVCNYSAAMNGIGPDTQVGIGIEWWRALLVSLSISFAVLTAGCCAMYVISIVKEQKKKEEE